MRRRGSPAHQQQRSLHPDFVSKGTAMKLLNSVKKFLVSEDGPTAVEYAVMMALIIVVCIGTITSIGNNANARFGQVDTALSS